MTDTPAIAAPVVRALQKYEFLWRRDDKVWRSKTITAESDAAAIEKMLDHCQNLRGPIIIDYEMVRADVPYNYKNHAATFINLVKAGVSLRIW